MKNDRVAFSRREAMEMFVLAAALPVLPARPVFALSGDADGAAPSFAPSAARAAVIHDALTLLASDSDVTGEWQEALLPLPVGKPFEYSYAYGVASLSDDGRLVRDVVAEVRAGWNTRKPAFPDIQRHKGGMMERRLGVAIGWAANHGATPVLFDGIDGPRAALVLDGVFLRALIGDAPVSQVAARRVFRLLYERTLVAMHTLEPDLDGWGGLDIAAMHEVRDPDQDEVNRFIDGYADWIDGIDRRCAELAEAVAAEPPPGVPAGARFYDGSDPVVAAAAGLRRGRGTAHPPNAWRTGGGTSRYADALSHAYANARLVLETARGDRPVSALEAMFDS